jgi:pyruvate carboxylase
MHISIEQGKMLIIRLMAVGPVVEGRAQREVWFEVNGEVSHSIADILQLLTVLFSQLRAVAIEDKNSAVETVSRERATSDPGSVGAPMSGVVVEVRVKEGQEILKGDPLCGM